MSQQTVRGQMTITPGMVPSIWHQHQALNLRAAKRLWVQDAVTAVGQTGFAGMTQQPVRGQIKITPGMVLSIWHQHQMRPQTRLQNMLEAGKIIVGPDITVNDGKR